VAAAIIILVVKFVMFSSSVGLAEFTFPMCRLAKHSACQGVQRSQILENAQKQERRRESGRGP